MEENKFNRKGYPHTSGKPPNKIPKHKPTESDNKDHRTYNTADILPVPELYQRNKNSMHNGTICYSIGLPASSRMGKRQELHNLVGNNLKPRHIHKMSGIT